MADRQHTGSEDDDSPISVSFRKGKEISLGISRQHEEKLKRDAALLKKVRRSRQERNAQQKKLKKMRMELSPLPESLLKDVKEAQETNANAETLKDELVKASEEKLQKRKRQKRTKQKTKVLRSGKVVVVKDATKDLHEPSYSQLSAEEFLRKAFFRPDVERVPVHWQERKRTSCLPPSF